MMEIFAQDPLSTLTTLLLAFSVLALWIPVGRKFIFSFLAVYGLSARFADRVTGKGIVEAAALFLSVPAFFDRAAPYWRRAIFLGLALFLSLFLGSHYSSAFHNWELIRVKLSATSANYALHINYDKPLIGIAFLLCGPALAHKREDWKGVGRHLLNIVPVEIVCVSGLALAFGYVRWDPKFPSVLPLWMAINLLFTCVAEEALFRGFLQRNMARGLENWRWGKRFAWLAASLLFGAVHFAGGPSYVVLSTVAGLFYGYAFMRSGKIETSIFAHFFLNLFHFLFLSYPHA